MPYHRPPGKNSWLLDVVPLLPGFELEKKKAV
jgi:hypothetical protein